MEFKPTRPQITRIRQVLLYDDPAPHLRFLKVRRDVADDEVLAWFVKGEACIGYQATEEYATVVILYKWIGYLIAQKGRG